VETSEVILYLPHSTSKHEDIKRFGRHFGHIAICSLSGCSYTISWAEDVWEWLNETGVMAYAHDEPSPNRMFSIRFKDPGQAALFKLRWL
jgi:hypothetical protein